MTRTNLFARYFKADELQNDDRGWAYNLAIFRLVFLGGAVLPFALVALRWTAYQLPQLPRDTWKPISFYRYLPFDLIANAALSHALAIINVVLVVLGLLGVWTRVTLGLATITSLYVFGLMQNQGKVDHFHHVVWFMALLAVGPSGRVLSFDSVRAATRGAGSRIVDLAPPKGTALLALRFIWVLFGLVYLTPGLSKLEAAISDGWVTTDNLRNILWRRWLLLYLYEPAFELPLRVDTLPFPLLTLGGLAVILFEATFIFLVLLRPARQSLGVSVVGFHMVNALILHIPFTSLMVACVSLFDWAAMGRGAFRLFERRHAMPRNGRMVHRHVADSPRRDPPESRPTLQKGADNGFRQIQCLGALLVLCQLSISMVQFTAAHLVKHLRAEHPVRVGVLGVSRRLPAWPFDGYPTFADSPGSDLEIWEARAALSDGREVRLGPHSYARVFGEATRCRAAADGVRHERNPDRHRDRSLELVRALWPREDPEIRSRAIELRIYHVRYGLDPADRQPRDERLMHAFPVGLVSTPGSRASAAGITDPPRGRA